jgi:hypothetical protein
VENDADADADAEIDNVLQHSDLFTSHTIAAHLPANALREFRPVQSLVAHIACCTQHSVVLSTQGSAAQVKSVSFPTP